MTYKELLEKTKDIDLESFRVYLGRRANVTESLSLYRDGDEWVMRIVDERQRDRTTRGSEKTMCDIMYENILAVIECC
ncbi:MAG: hypothetical protein J5532_06465 [Lachnospiraceae bacterium]|nr:hypothetical protein [Lachnospiraceae bacterium]